MSDQPWLDPSLPLDERVDLLVGEMSLGEKCQQMLHEAPAIERLGVPEYNWWNEVLHGVARAGKATVFPQAIGMAASFNDELLQRVAVAISADARAKHHQAVRQGYRGQYFGLTCWSPNINIFRDPRWGRGQETYGEDPHLTARLGVAFCQGLQGDDPNYLKVVATPKHYAVHSGPEPERHSIDVPIGGRDLWETYLPHFQACIQEAGAYSIMGAYNRVNGEPCCASPTLMTKILREEWGFPGFYVSDCWALRDFHEHHKITTNMSESAALGVKEGCDLNCGCSYNELLAAAREGLVTEDEIDICVKRLMKARFKLGMFDTEDSVPYASIPPEVVHCEEHRDLAREMARQSMVLLKNENELLPLSKEINRVLVVGPNALNIDALLANYNGFSPQMTTPFDGILDKLSVGSAVDYAKGCDLWHDEPIQKTELNWRFSKDTDVIVAVLGNTTALEGEEGESALSDGGGDRSRIGLPGRQQELLEFLVASGKPVVLVVMSGSPIDLSWAKENVPAILYAWYPGEAGGHAIADVLFGDVNPAGRLPISFPKSLDQLPEFRDYRMQGRTYRFMEAEPLYRFGHGLSYTTFDYANLRCSPVSLTASELKPQRSRPANDPQSAEPIVLRVSADVRNTGERAGDEVVQLYVRDLESSVPVPNLQLEGFRRLHLEPGETRTVEFELTARQLACYDDDGRPFVEPGEFEISVGGGQPVDPAYDCVTGSLTVSP